MGAMIDRRPIIPSDSLYEYYNQYNQYFPPIENNNWSYHQSEIYFEQPCMPNICYLTQPYPQIQYQSQYYNTIPQSHFSTTCLFGYTVPASLIANTASTLVPNPTSALKAEPIDETKTSTNAPVIIKKNPQTTQTSASISDSNIK